MLLLPLMWALHRPLILGTNMLVGNGIRLRQLRIKPEPCERKGPKGFEEITKARPPAPTHARMLAHTRTRIADTCRSMCVCRTHVPARPAPVRALTKSDSSRAA